MNGWINWQSWNVAMWIGGDETLHDIARMVGHMGGGYMQFASILLNDFESDGTPDGAAWDDPALDIDGLDELIGDL